MKNKVMLIIVPQYFGYEKYLLDEFQKKGYKVYTIFENIDNISILYRMVIVFLKRCKWSLFTNYYIKYINKINDDVEKVLVIRGSSLTKEAINAIKMKWPKAELIMYQWDSVKNNTNAKQIANSFSKIFTFDMDDARKFGWHYRPLFYISSLCGKTKKNNDFSYICLLHSQRAKIYNKLKLIEKDNGYHGFYYVFMFRLVYFRHKYLINDPEYKSINIHNMKFNPLPLNETNEIYKNSKVIIDYTHPGQNGYTMRTIESIGHKCKLVTNNSKIKEADFYSEDNILLYNGVDISIPKQFIDKPFKEYSDNIYKKYSIEGFISDILDEK